MKDHEIERKWLIKKPFPLTEGEVVAVSAVDRFYISFDPEIRYARIRKVYPEVKEIFIKTYKSRGGLIRKEINEDTDILEYNAMLDIMCNIVDRKTYIAIRIDGHDIEISALDDYIYAEVEFESEEEAKAYEFPYPDCVKEVTGEDYYKMVNHYIRTLAKNNFGIARVPDKYMDIVDEAKEKLANVKE